MSRVQARATHNVVLVADIEGSLAFYRDLLGLTVTYRQMDYVEFDGRIALCSVRDQAALFPRAVPAGAARALEGSPVAGNSVVLIKVDDVDAWIERLRDQGVPVLAEPADYPWGERFAFVADPEGNPVGLYR